MLSPRIVLQIKWGNAFNVFLTVPGHMEETDKLLASAKGQSLVLRISIESFALCRTQSLVGDTDP